MSIEQVAGTGDGFQIVIRREKGEICVSGDGKNEATTFFITGGSMNPFKWRCSKELFEDIEKALLENGVEEFDPYDNECLKDDSKENH